MGREVEQDLPLRAGDGALAPAQQLRHQPLEPLHGARDAGLRVDLYAPVAVGVDERRGQGDALKGSLG